ncbi:hypothetical protein PInf_010085 [Phytophthora infestans]|nr:hypothetical protein PInf_010085 [Phytophthora infestans]
MPPRRVTRAEAEAFLRRLDGKEGAERARLLEEHRAYVDGTRDRDADFGDDVAGEPLVSAPTSATTGRRPRMTVASRKPPAPATYQKKIALVGYYNLLARAPRLKGKALVAALHAEELATDAASADEDGSDSGDEDYVEQEKTKEMTTSNSRHDDDIYDGGALDSDYDDSDTGSAEWYEDMDNLEDVVDAEIPSESDTETSDELSLDAPPTGDSPSSTPAVGAASTTNRRGGQRPPRIAGVSTQVDTGIVAHANSAMFAGVFVGELTLQ